MLAAEKLRVADSRKNAGHGTTHSDMSHEHEQKHLLHNWSDCSYRDRPQIARAVLSVRFAGAIATKRMATLKLLTQ